MSSGNTKNGPMSNIVIKYSLFGSWQGNYLICINTATFSRLSWQNKSLQKTNVTKLTNNIFTLRISDPVVRCIAGNSTIIFFNNPAFFTLQILRGVMFTCRDVAHNMYTIPTVYIRHNGVCNLGVRKRWVVKFYYQSNPIWQTDGVQIAHKLIYSFKLPLKVYRAAVEILTPEFRPFLP